MGTCLNKRSQQMTTGPKQWILTVLLGGFSILFCSGCRVGPDYTVPKSTIPDAWHMKLTQGLSEGQADLTTWWKMLQDPVLDDLIGRATEGNLDLKTAVSRIRQARAQRSVVSGQSWPQVDGTGYYSRDRASGNGLLSPLLGEPDQTNLHSIGLDASWEIDLFGRIARSVESADASLEATIEDYRDTLVTLYAEVAVSYVQIRALQGRIDYALQNIELQKQTLELTRNRFQAELAPELDVAQAELNLSNTESTLPALETALAFSLNRLAVLLGRHAGSLEEELVAKGSIPSVPRQVVMGLPAELLRQRPDIRRAERLLAAQTARIGVATAGLYPAFSLSGTFALEATELSDVGDRASRTYGFGPAFRWNLFDGNRIRSGVQVEETLTEQSLLQYEQTVLLAVEEVEDAIVAYVRECQRKDALQRSVDAAGKSVQLVNTLYRSGLTDFQNVLDMQRALSLQQDRFVESRGLVLQDLIMLYKALGGGWSLGIEEEAQKQEQS
ncbi:MAG: efflux transporter outer membrane subunit [Sedimentisphaerales bacterium]|nr:efflux transporter outer membrane subunit [Sedimentisphaerales bacterium]